MKIIIRYSVFLLFIAIITSCTEKKGPPPPAPPDPFPIELTTFLDELIHTKSIGTAKVGIRVWTNIEYESNVRVKYTLHKLEDNSKIEVETKNIFDRKIELNKKEEFYHTIEFKEYGNYLIVIYAEYDGWGQQSQTSIKYDDKSIKRGIQ